tara:strand:+ start:2379 stop:3431 length:1053 start_codon:yes stop_codon:yes gene_type:complete
MSFKRLDPEDFVVSADSISSTVWTGNEPILTTFFTSSTQENGPSGDYYLDVFNTESNLANNQIQFAIAYGDQTGGGALAFNAAVNDYSPTTTMYGSYRTLVLEDENSSFTFGNVTSSYFYAISVERARYKETLFPGSLNLKLSSSVNGISTPLELTDNSQDVTIPQYFGTMRAYQVISGSNGTAYNKTSGLNNNNTGYTQNSGSYGLFLPDISTIILNGAALDIVDTPEGINLNSNQGINTPGNNPNKLYLAMSGSEASSFGLACQETITSDYVFVRARSSEFNYSENPSFISGSTGEVIYSYFINNPNVFPTTVGLYNDSNDLLAVAKLSKPILKDFTKEALIRVKLDF